MKRAIFLDRDGVINKDIDYAHKIKDIIFIEGIFDAIKFFKHNDFLVIIITNQAGLARKLYSLNDYLSTTKWMIKQFEDNGCLIDEIYYCPHHPDYTGPCNCRKPNIGMINEAKKAFKIDLNRSIIVGDKRSDIVAGKKAGIGLKVLVRSGHPIQPIDSQSADLVVESLKDYELILSKYDSFISKN